MKRVARPTRIAYVAVSFLRSGTEQVILDLARYFVAAGHEVAILIPKLPALEGMAAEARLCGASVERVGPLHSAGHNVLRNGVELFEVFRRIRPDVVHFHVPWEPICFESIAAAMARVPVRIRTEHNPVPQPLGLKERLKMALIDHAFHAVVYISEGNRRSHVANLSRTLKRSTLIGNGVDPRCVNPDRTARRRLEVRRHLDLPAAGEIAVMVGTLEQRKGPLHFVQAARVAATIHPTMHFAVIGEGNLRAASEEMAAREGISDRVHFLGRRPDVRDLLGAFDLYVQASQYEGMSVAMLEALAAGLPMVTTRVDGVEDVLPNGMGALQVDIGDWRALGEAMARLAGDAHLRAQLAATAQQRVLSGFTVDTMCERYAALYRRLGAPV